MRNMRQGVFSQVLSLLNGKLKIADRIPAPYNKSVWENDN